ncbi:MAG: hypothetical protein M9932_04305 [Xanthobacteraceae bacterium]|nr:hypothetical protein [Xanthobacteraceae bacterium]
MVDPDFSARDHWRAEQEKRLSGLRAGGGGGTSGGMEARVAKLEATLEHIGREMSDIKVDVRTLRDNARTDFRVLFGAIIAVALGLAGLLAKGFHWF